MSMIPLDPTEPMTLEVSVDELHVLKHLRGELHAGSKCRVCRTDKWWYEKYNEGRAEGNAEGYARGYKHAVNEVATGTRH